jgi:hypothetical protein
MHLPYLGPYPLQEHSSALSHTALRRLAGNNVIQVEAHTESEVQQVSLFPPLRHTYTGGFESVDLTEEAAGGYRLVPCSYTQLGCL